MRLAFGLAEDVHLATDAGGQRHHVGFTQRIDWRVGDLRKLLAEVVVNDARLAGEHGKRGIVTHRADRFLAVLTEHADDGVQLFRAVVKLLLVAREGVIVQLAAAHFFIRQIFKRHQTTHVFLHPLFVRMAALQIVVGFGGVQDASTAGVDHHQLARTDAAFLDHFVRLVIPDADFRGAGDELIFGDDVARRTQAVTVQVTGSETTVGHDDARRAVPRLHVHGVKVEERAKLRVHIRVVLPGRRHEQTHGAHDIHPARQQQFQHVIHRAGVRAGFVHERRGIMQVRDQWRLELVGTGAGPLAVTGNSVDLTVVCQVAERLRQRPAWNGVGGEALVEQANGRFQTQVRQVQVEARQVSRHTQTFIDVHQVREATDVELFIVLETFFNAAAGDKQTAFHITRTPARRRVDENLFNTRQRGEGDFTEHPFVGWHIAPADNRQGFTLKFFFDDAA